MILTTFLTSRKDTTHPDEYKYIIDEIYNEKEDYLLLNIIERFTMTEYFWLTLTSTHIINVIIIFSNTFLGYIYVFAKESSYSVL